MFSSLELDRKMTSNEDEGYKESKVAWIVPFISRSRRRTIHALSPKEEDEIQLVEDEISSKD